MFTTRSRCPPAPVTDAPDLAPGDAADAAVILVAHGSSRVAEAVLGLDRLASALREREGYAEVAVATLHGSGHRPADVVAALALTRAFVVPVMMCDGLTVQRDLPAAFSGCGSLRLRFCQPVGTHPGLAALIAERAAQEAKRRNLHPAQTRLLLIAHGSTKNTRSEQATLLQAGRLAAMDLFREVAAAYLEQPPSVVAAIRRLRPPVIAVGLFAAEGRHATVDVEAALAAAGRPDVAYLGAIGTDPGMAQLVAAVIRSAARTGR
ncbi:MAG: CbiX/SirB N-terminal domain-containing protein [Defluviicoccus sp.]|nr:CbiX/SirB N-terminal domain-containing protein [Defluviicoccus sp.]MDG4593529.1 CbiX/SirB N-terminal domain-containing protein [Defluviicoccus sp.]